MRLRNAIAYHAKTELDCWSPGTGWVQRAVRGSFLPFDRFITERSFGQKKRIFMTDPTVGTIPEHYTVVRLRTGSERRYLISAHNEDVYKGEEYSDVYLLQEAPYQIDILRLDQERSASGDVKGQKPVLVASTFGDLERLTAMNSEQFLSVAYTTQVVTLPEYTEINTDNELRINGIGYDVTEVWETLRTVVARVNKRSHSV